MNNKYFPENWLTYKIGQCDTLLALGEELYNIADNNNLLRYDTTEQSSPIRATAFIHGSRSTIREEFKNTFNILASNIAGDTEIDSFHIEKLNPAPNLEQISNTSTRLPNIIPSNNDDLFNTHYKHGAALWHFDNAQKLNNMVFMIFLDDIDGGTCIADPVTPPIRDIKAHRQTNVFQKKTLTDDIRYKEVTGPPGTFACFSSHVLHRAGIPKMKERRVIMINFLPTDTAYFASGYRDMDITLI